jgi:hypothetical protein
MCGVSSTGTHRNLGRLVHFRFPGALGAMR